MDNRNTSGSPNNNFGYRQIILASQSPRRRQLLEWAEVAFEVVIIPTDETYPDNLPVDEVPVHIARQKALAVRSGITMDIESVIIAADTIVVLNGRIIGKPGSAAEAFEILSQLSGRSHQVITGVCISGREEVTFSDTTSVAFHELTPDEIWFYINKYKPYDKAGAYGIQEWIGVTGIKSIDGDFYNVMGLPVSRVLQVLKSGRI
ncbi:MAG: septum formation protein Maf [Chitinophagaceae bacterium]|nr:MAG: septum formation protein Maf [Chitinophagaceae bacterium]